MVRFVLARQSNGSVSRPFSLGFAASASNADSGYRARVQSKHRCQGVYLDHGTLFERSNLYICICIWEERELTGKLGWVMHIWRSRSNDNDCSAVSRIVNLTIIYLNGLRATQEPRKLY